MGFLGLTAARLFRRPVRITEMPELLARGETRGPDFICIGAQKGGTRWLFDQLNHHPDFWMPPIKELHYFNENIHLKWAEPLYRKARSNLGALNRRLERSQMRALDAADVEWLEALIWLHGRPPDFERYARLFNPRGRRLSGDVTPTYSIIAGERVAAVRRNLPHAKLVYIAREPIERFWSHYCMIADQQGWRNAGELATVERFIETGSGIRHSSITDVVGRWRGEDNADRFGFFFFDDLRTDPAGLRRRVIAFLGGDPDRPSGALPPGFNRKSRGDRLDMTPAVRDRLVGLLGPQVTAAAAAFGGPAADWPAKYGL